MASIKLNYVKGSFLNDTKVRPSGNAGHVTRSKRPTKMTKAAKRELNALVGRIRGNANKGVETKMRSMSRRATVGAAAAARATAKAAYNAQQRMVRDAHAALRRAKAASEHAARVQAEVTEMLAKALAESTAAHAEAMSAAEAEAAAAAAEAIAVEAEKDAKKADEGLDELEKMLGAMGL